MVTLKFRNLPNPLICCESNVKVLLCSQLSLFGGVDLALVNEDYFFIEVNPTGEWGWLNSNSNQIDKAIADCMMGEQPQ